MQSQKGNHLSHGGICLLEPLVICIKNIIKLIERYIPRKIRIVSIYKSCSIDIKTMKIPNAMKKVRIPIIKKGVQRTPYIYFT